MDVSFLGQPLAPMGQSSPVRGSGARVTSLEPWDMLCSTERAADATGTHPAAAWGWCSTRTCLACSPGTQFTAQHHYEVKSIPSEAWGGWCKVAWQVWAAQSRA